MGKSEGYKDKELFDYDGYRRYSGEMAREVAFPIGGIGTGCMSMSGTGELIDWEIFNRPNKGAYLPNTFMMLRAQREGDEAVTKVLQGRPLPSFTGTPNENHGRFGDGLLGGRGIGLPHFAEAEMRGEHPIAQVSLEDDDLPLEVTLEAYNPFIPLNPDDSSIPVAIFNVRLYNPSKKTVKASLAASLFNATGYDGAGSFLRQMPGQTLNRAVRADGYSGVMMGTAAFAADHWRYGTMVLATTWDDVDIQASWERSGWFDATQAYWDEFSATGRLQERQYKDPSGAGQQDTGAIALQVTLEGGDVAVLPVIIAWHFPTFRKYWGETPAGPSSPESDAEDVTWRNYYASLWDDAQAVAAYVAENGPRLYAETKQFRDALFDSTLPWYVLDAVSSQMSTLKTPTCLRLEDGTFYGFEGVCQKKGCCEGSCTHVWNYAQTLPFLFPSLERSMREADYRYNQREDGWMCFRLQLPLGSPPWTYHAAADGQMGGIIKAYRDWKLSGDDDWLKSLWPRVRNALEYAWQEWDADRDGVMEGVQHNTYDIEFHGPNTMMGTFYLAALRAASEMASHLGEEDVAAEYQALFASGSARLEEMLFNGDYYVQKNVADDSVRYQFDEGCLSDQLIGQWFARIVGLGDLLNPKHVRKALASIMEHNWMTDFYDHACCQRIYAINDDKGLLLCTWPQGGRPTYPFPYSDEVWCGIEYQVASHMIYEGLVDEGLSIARGVRERHDGYKRNPWNEFECGSHYARSMAAWSLLTALSGYQFDMGSRMLGFEPRLEDKQFATFWSTGSGWGTFRQRVGKKKVRIKLEVEYGELELKTLRLGAIDDVDVKKVTVGDEKVKGYEVDDEDGLVITFQEPIRLGTGETLDIRAKQ